MKKWILLTTLALLAPPASSENLPGDDIDVSLTKNDNGSHLLAGGFSIASSTNVVWDVLTDYDHMAEFVSSIKSSRRLERQKDREVVEQVMSGKAAFFRKRIYLLLNVEELPGQKIVFEDVSKKSFKIYTGSWEITPIDGQIQVNYQLEAKPDFFAPDFIAVKAFKNTVKMLLTEVHKEIASREAPLTEQPTK